MSQSTILFGERVKKTQDNPYGWITLYNSTNPNPKIKKDTLLGKKSVIIFPGDGSKNEREANGYCGHIENMLLLAGCSPQDMPHIYGLAYQTAGKVQKDHRLQLLTRLNQNRYGTRHVPQPAPGEQPYYQPFFDEYILPLMIDEQGKPRPVSEIKKNIQNVTFVSHCHGGFMAYQIEQMMAQTLAKFYPKQMEEIMNNIHMLHLASRRPKGTKSYGTHFHIISHADKDYVDEAWVEYDAVHAQIHRSNMPNESVLVAFSPNEEALVLKQLATAVEEENGQIFIPNELEHAVMGAFSGGAKDVRPENKQAIQLVQHILRHFVEHPDDTRNIETQLKDLDPTFVKKNIEQGKTFLVKEKSDEKFRRGLLSMLSNWGAGLKISSDGGKKVFNAPVKGRVNPISQRDDEGRFLYDTLKNRWLQSGDRGSLLHYIENTGGLGEISEEERGNLATLAIQQQDWKVLEYLNHPVSMKQFRQIMEAIHPEKLHHLLPLLKAMKSKFEKESTPQDRNQWIQKITKIKNQKHKKQLDSFLKSMLQEPSNLKTVLEESSIKRKKLLKTILETER